MDQIGACKQKGDADADTQSPITNKYLSHTFINDRNRAQPHASCIHASPINHVARRRLLLAYPFVQPQESVKWLKLIQGPKLFFFNSQNKEKGKESSKLLQLLSINHGDWVDMLRQRRHSPF